MSARPAALGPVPGTADASADRFPLPPEMRARIVAQARAEAPQECCGMIAGPLGRPERLYALTNAAASPTFYQVDDAELFRVWRDIDERGWEVLAIYHSHPASAAYPSATDIELAAWPDAVYLICSLADSAAPDLRGFRIVDGRITEVEITG